MKKWRAALVVAVAIMMLPSAVPAGGSVISQSKDFKHIANVPIGGIAVSAQAVGDTYFISSWQSGLYSYNIEDPTDPVLLDHMTADEIQITHNENEDLATNGKILLLSQFNRADPVNRLMVIDVRDPSDMKVLSTLDGAGGHTLECLYDCSWAYASSSGSGSAGLIIDLRNPKEPKLLENRWSEAIGDKSAHDVTEVRPGLVVTSSTPMFALDTTDPANPKALSSTDPEGPHTGHNNIWPRGGKDRFLLSASETSANGRCEMYSNDNGRTLQVWGADGWRTRGFKRLGTFTLSSGTSTDGKPILDATGVQGCSAHWAHENPRFKNGGLVAMAAWSHGVRLLDVSSKGEIEEVAWFLKDVQGAVDVEWITDRILYVVEDGGGLGSFDVIEYTGKL